MNARRQSRGDCLRQVLVLLGCLVSAGAPTMLAQTGTPVAKPYASMDAGEVDYRGPGREKHNDSKSSEVRIGLLLPLHGTRAPEGKLLLNAAQIAIDEENRELPLANGQRFTLAVGDESGPWGQASSEMVRLIMQDEAVVLITGTDGNFAHQAEQIANKVGISVVTLSSDPTTTRINIPWIFRVGPSDAEQARAMAEEIYGTRGLARVLLITEAGHDGRIGGEEFRKAVAVLRGTPPDHLEINPESFSLTILERNIRAAEADAVVLWTGHEIARQLIPGLLESSASKPIYLCRKAADFLALNGTGATKEENGLRFTVGTGIGTTEFAHRYREATGRDPSKLAAQMNEAVKTVAAAVRLAGNNRARVRDRLASSGAENGTGGIVSFDAAGNKKEEFRLVTVEADGGTAVAP